MPSIVPATRPPGVGPLSRIQRSRARPAVRRVRRPRRAPGRISWTHAPAATASARRRRTGWRRSRSPARRRAARAAGARCGRRRAMLAAAGLARVDLDAVAVRAAARAAGRRRTRRPIHAPSSPRLEHEPGVARAARGRHDRRGRRAGRPSAARTAAWSTPSVAMPPRGVRGRRTFAPRCAYSSGMIQACARQASATGSASGCSHISIAAAPTKGTT